MAFQFKQQLDSNPDNYLDLYKWFTDDAGKIKDKMWTIAAFFYTGLGGLLGYAGSHLKSTGSMLTVDAPVLVGIVVITGCIISSYGIYMIYEYGSHIRGCWNRANYIRFRIEGLSEIWCFDDTERIIKDEKLKTTIDNSTPPVAKRLMFIMAFFLVMFLGLGVIVLTND